MTLWCEAFPLVMCDNMTLLAFFASSIGFKGNPVLQASTKEEASSPLSNRGRIGMRVPP